MTQIVSINSDNPGFIDPGFFRLKSNACLVLTEPGGVQEGAYIPGSWRSHLVTNAKGLKVMEYEHEVFTGNEDFSCQ